MNAIAASDLAVSDLWFCLNDVVYGFHMPTLDHDDWKHIPQIREQMCGEYLAVCNPFQEIIYKNGRVICIRGKYGFAMDYRSAIEAGQE
jgi:hypothetical protein